MSQLDEYEGHEWLVTLVDRDTSERETVTVRAYSDFGAYYAAVTGKPLTVCVESIRLA